ncbi:hypothetical protein [Stenotrophomonas sp. YAU14D1_LEIMI4_1]|uniref:hypothetical protein n=1 Tax=Stenotrophomonas sp. YAU14D1_LEIMI4_1 TaxID=2072407 RepID=UPI000D54276B|nr:hypothetical protein [Stenotrophomonas sp. YAU14D1_LEIMI4_1]AWH24020.1 hypothetical protein C1932_02230 [Stenotrophomonas sp. YAU14D1_LEIMI4_1]
MQGRQLIWAATLALFCGTTHAQTSAAAAAADLDAEMEIVTRNYITENPSVSIDDAITRLTIQGELNPTFEALRSEFADRLSSLSLRHAPDQHIFVELTGTEPVPNRVVKTESGSTRVVFETGNVHTEAEFDRILERNNPLIFSSIPGLTGISGFPGENRVLIMIEGDAEMARSLDPQVRQLARTMGLKVDIEPNQRRSRNLHSGPER